MIFALGVIVFIVILVISVAWHELGHLLPAKAFKVPVSQYMVGFGPTLWSKKVGETEYGIKWLLLGGYIRMVGMYSPNRSPRAAKTGWRANLADAAREATRDELAEVGAAPGGASVESSALSGSTAGTGPASGIARTASDISKNVADRAFYRLSAPRKLVVMLGGPTMNLILALILLALALSVVGVYERPATIGAVTGCVTEAGESDEDCGPGSLQTPAQRSGLKAGDKIVSWNGQAVASWNEFLTLVAVAELEPATIVVERDGGRAELEITPMEVGSGTDNARSLIGVSVGSGELRLTKKPLWDAPVALWQQVVASSKLYLSLPVKVWDALVDMIEGNDRPEDSPASIVGIARISGEVAQIDAGDSGASEWRLRWSTWLQLGAAVNIALWLFNLLPLLPLDGGHVVNALYEGGRRSWARWRHKPDPGPADSARLMPLTYLVVGLLILMTIILVAADVFNPYVPPN